MANATHSTSRLFNAVREAQDEQLRLADANEHARARARLLQVVDRAAVEPGAVAGEGRRSAWRWGLGGLAAAACALAVFIAVPGEGPTVATLSFELDGTELAANQTIVSGDRARLVSVSDSTRIELAPDGSMYIDEIRSNGATVVLERGEVALAVHHEDDTSWAVEAGPWAVHVTGTQFVVAWEPSTEHFRVAVTEGSVRVEGPDDEIASLRAGDELVRARGKATLEPETLEVDHSSEVAALEQLEDGAGDAPIESADSAGEAPGGASPGGAIANKPSKPAAPSWTEFFDDSDYQGAWQALTAAPGGIHGEATRADDAKTMLDLADVARFTKHPGDTRKVLEQLRDRFPNSSEAGEAAFALGRLAADGGDQAKATVWFERYLDERPSGSFASDALGRLMDCYEGLGQTKNAQSAAERYLAGFPKGPHVAKAEKILAR